VLGFVSSIQKEKKGKKKKKKKEGGGFYDLTYKTLTTFFSVIWICPVMMGYKLSTFGSCFDNKFCLSLVVDLGINTMLSKH